MAAILQNTFMGDQAVFVFNGFSFSGATGEEHRVSHLILHRWGIYAVETSVLPPRVTVTKEGRWGYRFEEGCTPMPNPVSPVVDRLAALVQVLNLNAYSLLDKAFGLPTYFSGRRFGAFVSIPDDVEFENQGYLFDSEKLRVATLDPEVTALPGSELATALVLILRAYARNSGIGRLAKSGWGMTPIPGRPFNNSELSRVAGFLAKCTLPNSA